MPLSRPCAKWFEMVHPSDSNAQHADESTVEPHQLPEPSYPNFTFWCSSGLTLLVCNFAFTFVLVLEQHYVACLICGWLGWFMIGNCMQDGEYSSLISAWLGLVMLGAPIGETVQFEREAIICCAVVMLPWLPLFVGTSVLESTVEEIYVFSDAVQFFRLYGAFYTGQYIALLGLLLSLSRSFYWMKNKSDTIAPFLFGDMSVMWALLSLPGILCRMGDIFVKPWALPPRKATLRSVVLASFGTLLSIGIRWVNTESPFSHLVRTDSPVYQVIVALLTLVIALGVIVGYSQIRNRDYPEQYIYSYQWRLRERMTQVLQLRYHILPSIGEADASLSEEKRVVRTPLTIAIVKVLFSPLPAIFVVAGLSMIDNPSQPFWQLSGAVGWFMLFSSLRKHELSSSIVTSIILIAFGSFCEGKNSSPRMVAILIGSPCFLVIVRHFNTRLRDSSSEEPEDLTDVERVFEVSGPLGILCLVAIQWLHAIVCFVPLLSKFILEGPKIHVPLIATVEPWELNLLFFFLAPFIDIASLIVDPIEDFWEPCDPEKEGEKAWQCFPFLFTSMIQGLSQLLVAPLFYDVPKSEFEALVDQVYIVIWTLLIVLMTICLWGMTDEPPLAESVDIIQIGKNEEFTANSIRAMFGLGKRLGRDTKGQYILLDDTDQ